MNWCQGVISLTSKHQDDIHAVFVELKKCRTVELKRDLVLSLASNATDALV